MSIKSKLYEWNRKFDNIPEPNRAYLFFGTLFVVLGIPLLFGFMSVVVSPLLLAAIIIRVLYLKGKLNG